MSSLSFSQSTTTPWLAVVDHHPPDWRFPAGASWIAGRIESCTDATVATDLRAWIDHRPVLGLHGLPRSEANRLPSDGLHYPGFSFHLRPHRGARQLRLERRDTSGCWHEFFRHSISVDSSADLAPPTAALPVRLAELQLELLRRHSHWPNAPLRELADDLVVGIIAERLDCLPNPPLHGALESPTATGLLRYGRLEVSGWLAHRTLRVTRLTATVDGSGEVVLRHRLPRQGVQAVFAELRDRDESQFFGHVDLFPDSPCPGLLKIFAELEDGTRHLAFAQRFTPRVIQGPEPALPTPLRPALFVQAAWALVRTLRHHQLPSTEMWRELGAAWRVYAAETPRRIRTPRRQRKPVRQSEGKPLSVVILTHNLNFEGAPWFIFEYARHLAAQPGWKVRVLSPVDGPLRSKFVSAGMGVELVDANEIWTAANPREFDSVVARLARRLDWQGTDLLVANTLASFWGVHVARAAGCRTLLYIHESAPVRRFFSTLLAPPLLPKAESAIQEANRVAFIAAASLPIYAHLERSDNFRVLPSWIDVSAIQKFAATHSRAELRARHGVPENAVVFANIGSVCERKGQHIFVRAAAQLVARTAGAPVPLCFLIVGARAGVYLDALRHDLALLGLSNVIVIDEVPDTYPFYRMADVFVCSSFEEAFPRVLMEAAAFSLPIVSTHVSGIPEMLAPDEAWLVPPGSADAMARAMGEALEAHRSGNRQRAERAHRSVTARFSAEASLPLHRALAEEASGRNAAERR